jgi:hypothetical protein
VDQRRDNVDGEWVAELLAVTRAHGAWSYKVEGFFDITDAVRRGHPVLVRREAAEVAEGVRVFDRPAGAAKPTGPLSWLADEHPDEVVTLVRFDVGTARFVLQDVGSAAGEVALTPRRLQKYLDDPARSVGVALGA